VYRPEEETVPAMEFPPAMPLTLQFTAFKLAPVTLAVNCCVWPSGTDAVAGCTVTVTFGGGFDEEELVSPQPEINATPAAIATQPSLHTRQPLLLPPDFSRGPSVAGFFLRLSRAKFLQKEKSMCLRPRSANGVKARDVPQRSNSQRMLSTFSQHNEITATYLLVGPSFCLRDACVRSLEIRSAVSEWNWAAETILF